MSDKVTLNLGEAPGEPDCFVMWLRALANSDDRRFAQDDPDGTLRTRLVRWIADQIEAQTKPPKPAEPVGLGAVVVDAHGRRWTKVGISSGCWVPAGGGLNGCLYPEIDAVLVLSEGVQ